MNLSKEAWDNLYKNATTNYEWLEPVLKHAGNKTLEIGCGSGLLSKRLLELWYDAYTNDWNGEPSERHLVFDVLGKWECGHYDTIFSCGLLEHFSSRDIVKILKKASKHADMVISLVPNDSCPGYWQWRKKEEKSGTWDYGNESTFRTLAPQYEMAGLKIIEETRIGNDFGDGMYLLATVGIK